ncbi:glycosyltransferase family 2 protein [Speluncibacter jeojiensis]|uniref:glycosyltransferase family 2 protein n=1 Tax=Speluncibacter jeojiensis TaxID=2710754 RepID=UPI00240EFDF4|nr:glycosyltransferase family 2 protein [Rhodococcus sp. D2-41]
MGGAGSVTVVIPCRNEAGSLPGVLAGVPDGYRALVVDNGSLDDTAQIALRCGAEVVREPVPGYGSAVHAGLEASRTEIVCVLDGDGSMDPGELPVLVQLVREGADLAVGRRRPVRRSGWPLHARVGNALIAARLRRRHGLPVHDIGAVRVARRDVLLRLGITDRSSGYPLELLVRAAASDLRVVERDVTYRRRTAGTSKVSGSVAGSVRAMRDFWRVIR